MRMNRRKDVYVHGKRGKERLRGKKGRECQRGNEIRKKYK